MLSLFAIRFAKTIPKLIDSPCVKEYFDSIAWPNVCPKFKNFLLPSSVLSDLTKSNLIEIESNTN